MRELLQNSVNVSVTAPDQVTANSPFEIVVKIENDRTGHNIPSGSVFERQMWIELIVKDAASETVYFGTGLLDANGDLRNHHSELVDNGQVEADTALTLFNGIAYDEAGNETPFFWEAKSVETNGIGPFQSHTEKYNIQAPAMAGNVDISFRLRFRSFPPYLFRSIGKAELIQELIIFDMETFQKNIIVLN